MSSIEKLHLFGENFPQMQWFLETTSELAKLSWKIWRETEKNVFWALIPEQKWDSDFSKEDC